MSRSAATSDAHAADHAAHCVSLVNSEGSWYVHMSMRALVVRHVPVENGVQIPTWAAPSTAQLCAIFCCNMSKGLCLLPGPMTSKDRKQQLLGPNGCSCQMKPAQDTGKTPHARGRLTLRYCAGLAAIPSAVSAQCLT